MSDNFSKSIAKNIKDDRIGDIQKDTNQPTKEDILNLELIMVSFIESVNTQTIDDYSLNTIHECRHYFKYLDEESSSRMISSDFVKSLFLIDFDYPLKWKAIQIIASLIYKDSPFIDQIVGKDHEEEEDNVYNHVFEYITKYQKGEKNYEEPFAQRTIGGLLILCNLASISKELIEPLLVPELGPMLFSFFPCINSLYLPLQKEKLCLALHALNLISNYTDEYINQSYKPFWALLDPKYKTLCPSVIEDSIGILISYFTNISSINHINIQSKLPFLFSYVNENNEISTLVLDLFVQISGKSQLAEELVNSNFLPFLLQSMASGNNLYLSFLIISNILSNQELVEKTIQIDGLIDMIKDTIMNGSIKDGISASLCILKIIFYLPIEQAYQIVDPDIIDQLITNLDEDDNLYLINFLQCLNKVISNETALSNPDERLFFNAISSSDATSRLEELSLIDDPISGTDLTLSSLSKSILEMLQS